ncbi:MAG: hypothetical protein JWO12_2925 [Frankiales bacterium]|nr:hypothetical protein [Frankiales bacterium]
MRMSVTPERATVSPGTPVVLTVAVTNTEDVISGHLIRVLGVDPRWVHLSDERLSLFPGATGVCVVTLTLPTGLLAGQRRVSIQVRELTGAAAAEVIDVDLLLPVVRSVETRLEPSAVTAGKRASFGLLVTNTGNADVTTTLHGTDEEDRVAFRFTPAALALGPGEHAVVEIDVKARRRFAGQLVVRPLTVSLHEQAGVTAEPLGTAAGTLMQRPVLGRGALSLGGLLAAVTVFALVITYALSGVVNRSSADRDLALQVAAAGQQGSASGTATLSGTVRLLTAGTPVPGVTVELVGASDTASVLASVATGASGSYVLPAVTAGSYKLRFRGAGFAELWYPSALTDADATAVDVQDGASKQHLDVRLGGLPATIAGTVQGADPTGAQVSLLLPGGASPSGTSFVASTVTTATQPGAALPEVRTTKVGSDGTFVLTSVPSPGVYDLAVSKPGFATQTERIDVGGGEQRTGVSIDLVKGDGLLGGVVRGERGPLVGASISARYGTTAVQTVSLAGTSSRPAGSFVVPGLPTPQTVTLVVSAADHATQSLSLSLAAGQKLTGLTVTLGGSSGTLSGVTRLVGGAPAAGVAVLVTGGSLALQTVTVSAPESTPTGVAGTPLGGWSLAGLPVPATYALTFSRADLVPQTIGVSLDAFGQVLGGSDLTVVLRPATLDLRGAVRVLDASGAVATSAPPPVTVTLASATSTYTTRAASVPAASPGSWQLDHVKPGTYTLTATARGSRPSSKIVHFEQGDQPTPAGLTISLQAPASIRVTVQDVGAPPTAGATVRLYLASGYPDTVLQTITTGADGVARFTQLDAPARYVVDYSKSGTGPQASKTLELAESDDLSITLGSSGATP